MDGPKELEQIVQKGKLACPVEGTGPYGTVTSLSVDGANLRVSVFLEMELEEEEAEAGGEGNGNEALEKHPAGAETEHEKVPSVEQVEAETEAVGGGAETEQADAEAETEEDGAGAETEQVGAEVETEQEKGPSAGAQEAERSDSAHTRTSSSFNGASDSGQFEALQPRPNFRELGDSEYPSKVWDDWESFERSRVYYKKKKGAGSGLDDEYEMDETDHAWLELVNEHLGSAVPPELFEIFIKLLEKESFLLPPNETSTSSASENEEEFSEEDSLCIICLDGECSNTDLIIFCDMCNIPVHQECYGVPYIPEGQWLCRRCLLSPSRNVDCIFCPNKGGALKQTEDGRWAHVSCATWIPEVYFSNLVFLEPVEGVKLIPPARWRLTCFVCKLKGQGACIQCRKSSCYTAFHVTCAQAAGMYMNIDCFMKGNKEIVKKTLLCNAHAPADHVARYDSPTARLMLKNCRKLLAERRTLKTTSVPTVHENALKKIRESVDFPDKDRFFPMILSYWKLKRIQRNGVPLLQSLRNASDRKTAVTTNREPNPKPKSNSTAEATTRQSQRNRTLKRKNARNGINGGPTLVVKRNGIVSNKKSKTSTSSNHLVNGHGRKECREPEPAYEGPSWEKDDWNPLENKVFRQHLEKVRLLCELVKKREKMKKQLLEVEEEIWAQQAGMCSSSGDSSDSEM